MLFPNTPDTGLSTAGFIQEDYDGKRADITTKQQLLDAWDEATEQINVYWAHMPQKKFRETINLFGQFNFPVIVNITYALDNEVHHRGQGYVYLRALGIEPPAQRAYLLEK